MSSPMIAKPVSTETIRDIKYARWTIENYGSEYVAKTMGYGPKQIVVRAATREGLFDAIDMATANGTRSISGDDVLPATIVGALLGAGVAVAIPQTRTPAKAAMGAIGMAGLAALAVLWKSKTLSPTMGMK